MLTVKERTKILNRVYPIEERDQVIELEIEEADYEKIENMAIMNNVTVDEMLFLTIIEDIEKNIHNI